MAESDVELTLNIKNLTSGIKQLTDVFADGMANISEMTNEGSKKFLEFEKRQAIMDRDRNKHLEKRYKLMSNARVMEVMSRQSGGGLVGTAMNFMGGMGQAKMADAQRLKELLSKKGSLTVSEHQEKATLQKQGSVMALEKMSDKFDKYFGGDSKWNKLFGGHGKMAATGIGLGAAAIGFQAVQKGVTLAIESSPLLQQMLKLWKFGIMMLLRPIATFFGMIMRPIMIVMLRKFIIPFYQKYMPIMMKLGDQLGNGIVKWLEDLFGGGTPMDQLVAALKAVGAGVSLLIGGVAVTKGISLLFGGKAFEAGFAGFKLIVPSLDLKVPEWLKKLLGVVDDKKTTPTPSTTTTSGSSVNKPSSPKVAPWMSPDWNKKPSTPSLSANKKPITPSVPPSTSKTNKWQSSTKPRVAPWMKPDWSNKVSVGTSQIKETAMKKSNILMDRVKEAFKSGNLKKGFEALRNALPKLQLPTIQMDSLRSLLSVATAKGVFRGALGSLGGGAAGAGGLPWMIAENLDHLPPAKEFREWFQGGMRQAAGIEDPEGKIIGEGFGGGVDDAVRNFSKNNNLTVSNPISKAIAGGSKAIQNWWSSINNGGGIFGADGGILNEPVIGFGQNTGRKYTLGERGREQVTPLNKTEGQNMNGGTNITINIQSMSGSQNDLNALRRTILNVIQETSIGRVRA